MQNMKLPAINTSTHYLKNELNKLVQTEEKLRESEMRLKRQKDIESLPEHQMLLHVRLHARYNLQAGCI
jgi:hypothetical protein